MNIFAGGKLKIIKPIKTPIKIIIMLIIKKSPDMSELLSNSIARSDRQMIMIVPLHRESTQSIKFIAFIIPTEFCILR